MHFISETKLNPPSQFILASVLLTLITDTLG